MPVIRRPSDHDTSYPPPRGWVLLLTCMDLRLLDETVEFMEQDNLTNRYDHIVFAGASLGALGAPDAREGDYSHWKRCFFDHLGGAVALHNVEDVYILEHRNCGAYHKVFQVCPDYGDSQKEQDAEEACHLKYARQLEAAIADWCEEKRIKPLRVLKFLMDLRGRVSPLSGPKARGRGKKSTG